MEGATNYNALLTRLIVTHATGTRRLLDFGAGIGTFSKFLRCEGFEVTCIEPDEYLAKRLQYAGFETYTGLDDIENGLINFVFSLNVFEHIADDSLTLAEITRKVSSGGKLLIYVPPFRCLWTILDDKIGHYRRYTNYALGNLVSSQGLNLISVGYADSLGFVAARLFKLIGNKEGELAPSSIRFYDRFVTPFSLELDRFCHRFFGKNVWVVCQKPLEQNP